MPDLPSLTPPAAEQPELFPGELAAYQDGRDELNLAEFPISTIGHRADPAVKTLVFESRALHQETGETVLRQLTVAASDRHGLPTALDDEVLLGLLQISRVQRFASPIVTFTPYQLLGLLGWKTTTRDYRRLRESIDRWLEVTLHYVNAWRDKRTGEWIDTSFHFLESATFHKPGHAAADALAPDGLSVVRWNETVFRNLREGNLKVLNFQLYRSLQSHVAKRIFRFLDKRLYRRPWGVFDLQEFGCERVGLVRPVKLGRRGGAPTTDVAQIKRRLLPAIRELEQRGFLAPLAPQERFTKEPGSGKWQVHFKRPDPVPAAGEPAAEVQPTLGLDVAQVSPLEGRLAGHGVAPAAARRLAGAHPPERIEAQLEALEFLLIRGGDGVPENRAGWLVKAVAESYAPPRGFRTRAQRDQEAQERARKARQREERRRQREEGQEREAGHQAARREEESRRVDAYLAGLAEPARQELEAAAVRGSGLPRGRLSAPMRRALLHSHVLTLLPPLPGDESG